MLRTIFKKPTRGYIIYYQVIFLPERNLLIFRLCARKDHVDLTSFHNKEYSSEPWKIKSYKKWEMSKHLELEFVDYLEVNFKKYGASCLNSTLKCFPCLRRESKCQERSLKNMYANVDLLL